MDPQDQPELTETVDDSQDNNTSVSSGQILINMESMIKSHISSIDKMQQELKKHREMLDDIFLSDPTFQEHLEKAKEASKLKQQTKTQILKQPQTKDLDDKIKTLRSEIKEQEAALSDYLQEYQRMSGVNEIEGEDGEVREIIYTAKLIKKSSIFK